MTKTRFLDLDLLMGLRAAAKFRPIPLLRKKNCFEQFLEIKQVTSKMLP